MGLLGQMSLIDSSSTLVNLKTQKSRPIDKEERQFQEMIRPRSYIIDFKSDYKRYWDYFVMITALYNALWTPFTVSFEFAIKVNHETAFVVLDYVVLSIFVADIVVQFLTNYLIVASGETVNKPSMIAKNYMASPDFIIDFLSTFPFSQIGDLTNLKNNNGYTTFASIMAILKVFRVRKIGNIISQLPFDQETKALTKIIYYAFLVIIILHTFACLLWFTLKTDNIWVAPTDFGVIRSRQYDPYEMTEDTYPEYALQQANQTTFIFQVGQMWYHSALLIMMVDITARTKTQLLIMSILYIIMAVVNATIFGLLFDMIEVLNKRDAAFQEIIDNANTAMTNLDLQ